MNRLSIIIAWFRCYKRPPNARGAWLTLISGAEYRCPCGRCDLPVIPARRPGDEA